MILINRIIIELKRAEYIRTGDQSPLRIDLSLTSMSLCYANDRYIFPKSFWSFCAFDFCINSLPLSLHVLVNSDQVLQLASYFAFFFAKMVYWVLWQLMFFPLFAASPVSASRRACGWAATSQTDFLWKTCTWVSFGPTTFKATNLINHSKPSLINVIVVIWGKHVDVFWTTEYFILTCNLVF